MNRPTGDAVAAQAVALCRGDIISYDRMDCQKFVETCINDCAKAAGLDTRLDAAGSNDMARHHCAWLGTLANAKAEGKLVLGAGLLIHEDDESGLPEQYRGDGLGDFSHVGLYVGENALGDVDKYGRKRMCNAVHSSQSMGRVAGSTLSNGWTHVMLFAEIDYGIEVGGLNLSHEAEALINTKADENIEDVDMRDAKGYPSAQSARYVRVETGNEYGLKVREAPKRSAITKYTAPNGTQLRVMGESGQYYKVMYNGGVRWVDRRYTVAE